MLISKAPTVKALLISSLVIPLSVLFSACGPGASSGASGQVDDKLFEVQTLTDTRLSKYGINYNEAEKGYVTGGTLLPLCDGGLLGDVLISIKRTIALKENIKPTSDTLTGKSLALYQKLGFAQASLENLYKLANEYCPADSIAMTACMKDGSVKFTMQGQKSLIPWIITNNKSGKGFALVKPDSKLGDVSTELAPTLMTAERKNVEPKKLFSGIDLLSTETPGAKTLKVQLDCMINKPTSSVLGDSVVSTIQAFSKSLENVCSSTDQSADVIKFCAEEPAAPAPAAPASAPASAPAATASK